MAESLENQTIRWKDLPRRDWSFTRVSKLKASLSLVLSFLHKMFGRQICEWQNPFANIRLFVRPKDDHSNICIYARILLVKSIIDFRCISEIVMFKQLAMDR